MTRPSLLNKITDEQLVDAINLAKSLNDLYVKLGYKDAPNSYSRGKIKARIIAVALKYGVGSAE